MPHLTRLLVDVGNLSIISMVPLGELGSQQPPCLADTRTLGSWWPSHKSRNPRELTRRRSSSRSFTRNCLSGRWPTATCLAVESLCKTFTEWRRDAPLHPSGCERRLPTCRGAHPSRAMGGARPAHCARGRGTQPR